MQNNPDLAAKVRSRHVWDLAWPTIISNLTLTSVGLVHIKFIGEHGTDAVAAVTTGQRVYFLLQAILMGLSAATTAVVARHWGSGRRDLAGAATYNSLILAMAAAVLAGIVFFFGADAITSAFGLESAPANLAADFVRVMALFNLFFAAMMVLTTAVRAAGHARTAMRYAIASAILNIVLGILFINGLSIGGLPSIEPMGAVGAAMAGGISAILVATPLVHKWLKGSLIIPFSKLSEPGENSKLIKLALPAAAEQGVINLGLVGFMALASHYGTAAFAAYGVGISILSLVLVIGFSFSMAGATLTAQYLGANNPRQAWGSAMRTLKMCFSTLVILGAMIIFFRRDLSAFMVNDIDVINDSVLFMGILAAVLPLMSIEMALGGVLRGAGDTRFPLIATFCGLFVRIIMGSAVIYLDMSLAWFYSSMIADYAIKAMLMTARFRRKKWLK